MAKKRTSSDTHPGQLTLPIPHGGITGIRAGRLCRKEAVREALTQALAGCGMSREEVAAEMTRLTGEPISRNHIDNWCSEAKREWRFPLELATAFCRITGDYGLVEAVLDGTGLGLADERTMKAAEYGRLLAEEKKRAVKKRELLEALT